MKKLQILWMSFKIVAITLCIATVVAILLLPTLYAYTQHFMKSEIYRENSPDNEYVFILYQVGSPGFPFGPVKAQIRVLNEEGKLIDKQDFSVNNDGTSLCEFNIIEIRWYNTRMELDLKGSDDDAPTTYVLAFE